MGAGRDAGLPYFRGVSPVTAVSVPHPSLEQVRAAINDIVDPCSRATGVPIGLVEMGIVKGIEVAPDGAVSVRITPTFAGCLFAGVFAPEIEERVGSLAGCASVEVELVAATETWTEEDMSNSARLRLQKRRLALRGGALRV